MNHIERMEEEFNQLDRRIDKLDNFLEQEMENPKLTTEEQRIRMAVQLSHMRAYRDILACRIVKDKEM